MFNFKQSSKLKKTAACLAVAALSVSLFAQSAFAKNAQSNANFMIRGTQILNDHQVIIFLDHGTSGIQPGMFKIYSGADTSGQETDVTSISAYSPAYNVSVSGLAPGTAYTLNVPTGTFQQNSEYTIDISNTVRANMGWTLGEWQQRDDSLISFYVPDANGYTNISSGDEKVFLDNLDTSNVAVEGNLYLSLSVPADPTKIADILSGIRLKKLVGGQYQDISSFSSYGDPSSPDGASYIYEPVSTSQNNFFYLPLSIQGPNYQKNLEYDTSYQFVIPGIPLVNGQTLDPQTISFHTQQAMGPSKMNSTPSVNHHDGVVDVSWTATTDFISSDGTLCNLAAQAYNVYRSTNPYWGYQKINSSQITGTSYTDTAQLGSGSYYYRVTPIANSYEGGLSNISNVVTIP